MSTITFDKLRYIEKLESGGFSHEQAKLYADALDDALRETVATRHDIKILKRDLTIRIFEAMAIAFAVGILLAAMQLT